jgi:putative tryptophan/tyrosine transport system substrate-binding protein
MILRRRDFITLLGGAAAWSLPARAQQSALPVIGYLDLGAPEGRQSFIGGFARGLAQLGFVEGRYVGIDYRSVGQDPDRLSAMATDLVRQPVDVIFTAGGAVVTRAAKAATSTIPIVFMNGADPVVGGLVASLNRPGGNVTGVTILTYELGGKRLQLMREIIPGATTIAYLDARGRTPGLPDLLPESARTLGLQIIAVQAAREADLSAAFLTAIVRGAGALILAPRPLFTSSGKAIAALAEQHKIPVMSYERSYPDEGGLISYGSDVPDAYRVAGTYAGRILKGEKPANLPVQQSVRIELVANLKAAKAIGLTIPESFLLRTDDVIE